MLVLPIEDTFVYVEPIYIQSAQTKMPQLKKVVLAMGNTLIYRDTYEQALAEFVAGSTSTGATTTSASPPGESPPAGASAAAQPSAPPAAGQPPAQPAGADARVSAIRDHLRRYREAAAQGRWSEAGRELEAVEKLVGR
jgi:uncharacterized membrane protein (UPF0182 family)